MKMKISLKMKVIIGIIIIIVILVGVYLSGFVRSNFENKNRNYIGFGSG